VKKLLVAFVLTGGITGCASIPDSVLIAQGERARIQLETALYVDVTRAASAPQISPEQIKKDIRECKDKAEGVVPKGSLTAYSYTGVISAGALDNEGAAFIACMTPKGYTATQWNPAGG